SSHRTGSTLHRLTRFHRRFLRPRPAVAWSCSCTLPVSRGGVMTDDTHGTEEGPRWRGINHLALITADMDATVRFYHGVLGARLVATIGTPQFRHYFFEFGPENTVAFFEYTGIPVESFAKPAGVPDPRAIQFDHLSFNLPDEHALLDLRDRLKSAACEVTDVVDH